MMIKNMMHMKNNMPIIMRRAGIFISGLLKSAELHLDDSPRIFFLWVSGSRFSRRGVETMSSHNEKKMFSLERLPPRFFLLFFLFGWGLLELLASFCLLFLLFLLPVLLLLVLVLVELLLPLLELVPSAVLNSLLFGH